MARRGRRGGKLAGLVSVQNKEIVDAVALVVAAGVNTDVVLATSVNDYTGTVGTCPLGALIKGMELMVSYSIAVAPNRFDWYLLKNNAGVYTPGQLPAAGATGGNALRKFIIHEEKGLAPDNADGRVLSKLHINIPKRYWRMGEADEWILRANSAASYDVCIKAIYK